jgi:DNA polymerase I-like protein with 3'-5' exonuclease and polymerase domains
MLNAEKLSDVAELEFACLPAVVEMEFQGINLDIEKWHTLGNALNSKKKQLEKALYEELGIINLDYSKEILVVLKSKGIDIPDTKRQTLMLYEGQYPIFKQIREYRKCAKLIQAFIIPIPKFVDDNTGRIHAEYHQLGASTGRITCRKPNLQQLPRDRAFRSCIKAPPGHQLIIADYSQIELRIVAEITGDETMIKAYQNDMDLHRMTAAIITGKHLEKISKSERQAAKAVNFGLIYAMGAEGLMTYAQNTYGVCLTIQQARNFICRFFNAYSGIARWHRDNRESTSSETRTLSGRRRLWKYTSPITEKLNTPIQGTSADILKKALSILPNSLSGTRSKIVACVHDEIVLEIPVDHAKEASRILVQTMITAGEQYLKKVPVEVDVTISDNWADK